MVYAKHYDPTRRVQKMHRRGDLRAAVFGFEHRQTFIMLHLRREEDHALTSRIAAPDQRHVLTRAKPRLDRQGQVRDAFAFEHLQAVRLRAGGSVRRTRR